LCVFVIPLDVVGPGAACQRKSFQKAYITLVSRPVGALLHPVLDYVSCQQLFWAIV